MMRGRRSGATAGLRPTVAPNHHTAKTVAMACIPFYLPHHNRPGPSARRELRKEATHEQRV